MISIASFKACSNFSGGVKGLFEKGGYFRNCFVLGLLGGGLALNLANWIVLWFFLRDSNQAIILHYNVYFGVDWTGDFQKTYLFPLSGLVLLLVNFFLALFCYLSKERIATHVLLMAGVILQLCLLVAVIGVIVINY